MKSTFKNIWFWISVVLVCLFLWKSCNKGTIGFFGCNKGDTLSHKIDTVITIQKQDTEYVPVNIPFPVKGETQYVPKWYKRDSLIYKEPTGYEEVKNTCQELENDYNTPKFYNDTNKFKNGTVIIGETVNNNMIMNRKVSLLTNDTLIKETTTILKHKIVVYFGMKIFGMRSDFLHQGEINLGVRGKNDMEYKVGIGKIRGSKENIYSFEVDLPIRLLTSKK